MRRRLNSLKFPAFRQIFPPQMLKAPEVITTTTEIVQHYRNDGADRVLIPLTDPELTIHYHISYLKAEEKRLDEMIHFLEHSAEL